MDSLGREVVVLQGNKWREFVQRLGEPCELDRVRYRARFGVEWNEDELPSLEQLLFMAHIAYRRVRDDIPEDFDDFIDALDDGANG